MTLTLRLRNVDTLSNGGPVQLTLDRRGATLGRSPTVDWSLPDPASFISSRHCEIRFEGGAYMLSDTSTNGTLVNGVPLSGPHRLANGDVIAIGQYEVQASLPDGFSPSAQPQAERPDWGGWDSHAGAGPAGNASAAADASGWGQAPARPAIAGQGPLSAHAGQGLASPAPELPASSGWGSASNPTPPTGGGQSVGWGADGAGASASPWDSIGTPPPPPAESASGWSSPAGASPTPSSAADIWGRLEQSNDVDWGRCGFGVAQPAPAADAGLGLGKPADSLPPFSAPPPAGPPASLTQYSTDQRSGPAPASSAPKPTPSAESALAAQFAAALGLPADALSQDDAATLAAAAEMLRALIGGMVVMLAARARAKAQMGAQTTVFEFGGNNPLKFARSPEEALAQMLNPPERGFKPAQQAIEEAFLDLQSHQMATLKAMQGALRATLDRFSPTAISQRCKEKGLLGQILPGAHDAALWRAYLKEFSGVAQGSDEAFMDVFSKEFRRAYDEEAAKGRR